MTAYLISLLEIIEPKVVLTFTDNSFKFSDLAKILDKKINFVAIQNAARYDIKQSKYLYNNNIVKYDLTKKLYIPNFLCFGQFEIDYYKRYKIKVENFFKVGSLRLANFFHYIKKNKIKLQKYKYDICLISEANYGRNKIYKKQSIEKGFSDIASFTIKFCKKHNMKLIFVCKRSKKDNPNVHKLEVDFYKKYLSNSEFNYLFNHASEKNEATYSSYMAVLQSKVVVGNVSTMLRENLAVGGKILTCNLTSTNIWDFPIQGISSIKDCNFEEFETRLLQIYSMTEKDYFSKLSENKCYTAEYDEKTSTIDLLKNKIDFFLNDSQKNNKMNSIH
tara:strand:- start:38 stop:1036 length:999 start_codon:yes stop_codon:yes gene_type:complete